MAIAKEAEAKKKTGTDGKSVDCIGAEDQEGGKSGENHLATHLAICLDKTSGKHRNSVDSSGQKVPSETVGKSAVSSQKAGFLAQKEESQRSDLNRQPPVYKTGAQNTQGVYKKKVTIKTGSSLATRLAISLQKHPELEQVVGRWPDMPEHVRQAILTLVGSVQK